MKNTFTFFQMSLLICGVFGVDADEVKTVTVMEGDSVTLNTDVTETQRIILMLWRFGDKGPAIAQINGKAISYPSYINTFTGKLQLDPTGSLTIKNMRIKHSGLYQLQIDLNSRPSYTMKFNVAVYESPSVVDAGEAEMKSVSVTEGYSVTLQTDVTEPHGDELIVWRFGDVGKLIVKHDTEAKSLTNYADERFRDRLKLDHQTGSLTITDTITTDSGLYTVKISSNKQTLYNRFIVTVSAPGLSPGAVAGIVVVLLLVFAVAAAVGVIFYRRKISELESLKFKSVLEGDDVTLNTDVTKIQKDDLIEWRVGDGGPLTAALIGGFAHIYHTALDERFTVRLEMDLQSGSLTITNTRNTDSGLYHLMIRQDGKIIYRKFYVSVFVTNEVRNISVKEGKSVILNSETEIQKDDQILWRFGDQDILIAELRGGTVETHDGVADGIFRGRLELDDKTGSLIITDMKIKHAGDYKLQIISSRGTTDKTFVVTVYSMMKSVTEGESVTLNPETEIQKDDQIQWRFGDILIAEVREGIRGKTHDDDDVRFRGRLTLDKTTGSLTITRMRDEHTGYYKLQISSSRRTTNKTFKVVVVCSAYTSETVLEGENVTLSSDTYIVKDEIVKWFCCDKILATRKKGDIKKTSYSEDRLELDPQTGSLTIKNTRTSDRGVYHLKFFTLGIERIFHVTVNGNRVTESATVQMPPVNEEVPDVGNKQEGMSLLVR